MISLTYDQLSNVIHNPTQRRFQHQYKHHDLIYECNIIVKNKSQHKRRCRRKHIIRIKTEYQNSLLRSINILNSFQYKYMNSTNRTIINSLSDIWLCLCGCRVNLEIFHLFKNYFTDICVYFLENFINLQLVLVIILSTFITCTKQSIATQVNTQQNQITSHEFLVTSVNDAALTTAINFNNYLHYIHHRHQIPNTFTPRDETEKNFKYQIEIYRNLIRHHRYFKKQKRHKEFNPRNITNKSLLIRVQSNSLKYFNNTFNYEEYIDNNMKKYNNNRSSPTISKMRKNNKNNTVIKLENNVGKNELKHQFETSNINLYSNNFSNTTNGNYNKSIDKANQKAANLSHNFNYIKTSTNSLNPHVDNDNIQINNLPTKLNLLTSTSVNRSLKFGNDHQHVDHNELIKVVLDGLGLKEVPKMEKVNISQLEYVTKYREYLERVRTRKCRNLTRENKEQLLRPLEILTINTRSTLLNQNQNLKRQKRDTFQTVGKIIKYNHNHESENNEKQSLKERVRNLLVSKKKNQNPRSAKKDKDERKSYILLKFTLEPEILNLNSHDIEEANLRLVLIQSYILAIRNSNSKKKIHTKPKNNSCSLSSSEAQKKPRKKNLLNLKLFQLRSRGKRFMLDERIIDIKLDYNKLEETHTQWLQFDVTKAVKTSIEEKLVNHVVLELQCDNCKRHGARVLNEAYNTAEDDIAHHNSSDHQLMPVLNIIGHFDQSQRSVRPRQHDRQHGDTYEEEKPNVRHYHHQTYNDKNENRHNHRTNCYKPNQRCCRHSMEVTFKEIKGFEFIIQPKVFDAGYCHGRCPPRYNPAHHHALLQSLIWKQNHSKAPRPCCAPSKLVELEVLHVDEKDSNKLKISTWSDMKVAECACS